MEHNITCPNCGAQIPVSGDVYESIAAQKDSQIASLQKELFMNEQAKASAVSQSVANEKDKARQKDEKIAQLHQTIAVMKNQLTAMKEQLPLRVSQSNAEHEKVEADFHERDLRMDSRKAVMMISKMVNLPSEEDMKFWESNAGRVSLSTLDTNMDLAMDRLNGLKSQDWFSELYQCLDYDARSLISLKLIAAEDLRTLEEIDRYAQLQHDEYQAEIA